MRRGAALAALGLGAYALFLVATMPARFVAERIERETRGALQLREAQGSAWNGSATAWIAASPGPLPLARLDWHWRPAALLAGRIAFEVRAHHELAEARAELSRGISAWEARDAEVHGDARAAAAFLPLLATWQPAGTLTASARALRFDGERLEGEATVEWADAALALSPVKPLGRYRAQVSGGSPARVALLTVSGPLRLSGQGSWSPASGLAFQGEARGDGEAARALEPLLDLLGPRRPDGSRTIAWRMP